MIPREILEKVYLTGHVGSINKSGQLDKALFEFSKWVLEQKKELSDGIDGLSGQALKTSRRDTATRNRTLEDLAKDIK